MKAATVVPTISCFRRRTVADRPILFSAPMVRAILEGRKTVTRRVVKPYRKHPIVNLALAEPTLGYSGRHNDPDSWGYEFIDDGAPAPLSAWPELCSYGQPGDRLWIRETFAATDFGNNVKAAWYRATQEAHVESLPESLRAMAAPPDGRWKPSIYMPRWASRITLEVTGMRVERLQDITESDAAREGCLPPVESDGSVACGRRKTAFRSLWESINGPDSWGANPWVWVIEFKRVMP